MIKRVLIEAGPVPPRHFTPYGKTITRISRLGDHFLVKCEEHGELAVLAIRANAVRIKSRHMLREH